MLHGLKHLLHSIKHLMQGTAHVLRDPAVQNGIQLANLGLKAAGEIAGSRANKLQSSTPTIDITPIEPLTDEEQEVVEGLKSLFATLAQQTDDLKRELARSNTDAATTEKELRNELSQSNAARDAIKKELQSELSKLNIATEQSRKDLYAYKLDIKNLKDVNNSLQSQIATAKKDQEQNKKFIQTLVKKQRVQQNYLIATSVVMILIIAFVGYTFYLHQQ